MLKGVINGTGSGGGGGTVTSVAETFTGGLISVAGSPITGAGTLALTVAGTSGGIPYFSGATTWASSGALTANSPVLGGGAGAAPKVSTAILTDGTASLTLGLAGTATGTLKVAGTTSGTATITAQAAASTPTLTVPTGTGTFAVSSSAPLVLSATTGNMTISNATTAAAGAVLVGSGIVVSSGTISVPSREAGIMVELTGTLATGTYDLGPVLQGGTVLNSYAHVASGTLTYTGAIGQPGTYTTITGMSAISSSSTTVDTIGTATAANVLAAGDHLWVKVSNAAVGGSVYFAFKTP